MKYLPGSFVPLNYRFWPESSDAVVMAMVTECGQDWISLCPVHGNLEAAGFMDYVVTTDMTPLKMQLAVMGELIQPLPLSAISQVFHQGNTPLWAAALSIPETVCQSLVHDLFYVLSHKKPQDAFKVARGRFLPPKSRGFKQSQALAADWNTFVVTAWQNDLAARGFKEKFISPLLDEIKKNTRNITIPEVHVPREPKPPKTKGSGHSRGRNRIGVSAGRLGSSISDDLIGELETIGISSSSRMRDQDHFDETAPKSKPVVQKEPKELTRLEKIKKIVFDHLQKNNRAEEAARLAAATFSDFLKALLHLFPRKD